MKKITDIIRGWFRLIFPTDKIEKLSKERMAICNSCEFIDRKGSKCAVSGTQPCCGECGCPLKSATRSKDYTCPKNKW